MPELIEVASYQFGIRLAQCRILGRTCISNASDDPVALPAGDTVAFIEDALRKLDSAFRQLTDAANPKDVLTVAGKKLIRNCEYLWGRWEQVPLSQLFEEYHGETSPYLDNTKRLEDLANQIIAGLGECALQATSWFALGLNICDGYWGFPFDYFRPVPSPRTQEPGGVWGNQKEVERLLADVKVGLDQLCPEVLDTQFLYGRELWGRVEAGLAKLPPLPLDDSVVDGADADMNWIPSYLGLNFDTGRQQVKRKGYEPIQLTMVPWALCRAIAKCKSVYATQDELAKAWKSCNRDTPTNPSSIAAAVNALKNQVAALGVSIENKRNVGWRFVEIDRAPKA
jgi:hypothetical protein